MDAEFECIACNVKRIIIGVSPVARGYERRSLECRQCNNLLGFVIWHRRPHPNAVGTQAPPSVFILKRERY